MEENRLGRKKPARRVGVLTFHWADNFGAMLQAYGLLAWLIKEGADAFIVNYTTPSLRGREWLIPYVKVKSLGEWVYGPALNACKNILYGRNWWRRRRLMEDFRRKYLTRGSKPIHRLRGLTGIEADVLVVGSDQVWNPNVTSGFQPAYFGAFENSRVEKTVAYAASFGTDSLPKEAEQEFSGLLAHVQEVSMREKGAAEYIKTRFGREACHVLDPVFLLSGEEWRAMSDRPAEQDFLLYYETEYCQPLREAASRTAREKGMKVIELPSVWSRWGQGDFQKEYVVGPAQFLGYLAAARYVFTNSFHGLAFSILLHKPFYVYNHATVGARITSLLEAAGLARRLASEGYAPDIEEKIDWMEVEGRLQAHRERSMEFLRRSLKL